MHRLQLLLLAVVVKSSVQLQCAAGQPEMVGNTMTCPVPVTAHYDAGVETVNPKVGVPGYRTEEIYPYYKDSTQWSEGKSAKLPTCTKNSDCAFASAHLGWYAYVGICYPAQNKRNSKLIEGGNFCFRAKHFDTSIFFVDPNAVGLRNCENSVDCADSKNMGGESFDPWYCNTWQGFFDLNRNPIKGVCMKARICGQIGGSDTGFASRPKSGSSCDPQDHSTCVDSGLAAVDSSHGYIPRCNTYLAARNANLCCHSKCVDGKARMKNGTFQCDHLITAAMRHSAGSSFSASSAFVFPKEVFPYYKDGNIFQKDSGKELSTCETNSDCAYLGNDYQGYCYPARNEATHLVVKNKKFCFKMAVSIKGSRVDVYIDPKAVGMQYCNNNSDCSSKPHYQGQWYCHEWAVFTDHEDRKPKGVCLKSKKTA